jgi:tetratricopeptide (TPR) repeat protein
MNYQIADAWKRRGQTRAAAGRLQDSISDHMKASSLTTADPDIFFQMGVVYYRLSNYFLGRKYIEKAIAEGERTADAYNSLGMCGAQLGDVSASLAAYATAVELQPDFLDALYNSGIIAKENGDVAAAELFFHRCISIDKDYKQAYFSLGVLNYSLARYAKAVEMFTRHIEVTCGYDTTSKVYLALSLQCAGRYALALTQLDAVISGETESDPAFPKAGPGSGPGGGLGGGRARGGGGGGGAGGGGGRGPAMTQREILIYLWYHLDHPFSAIDIDSEIQPYMKDAWCKKISWDIAATAADRGRGDEAYTPTPPVALTAIAAEEVNLNFPEPSAAYSGHCSLVRQFVRGLRDKADGIGRAMQLDCPGFVSNARQHRMFGLCVLHMAALLTALAPATSKGQEEEQERGQEKEHTSKPFSYKQLFNIAIRWRQVSEPNDAVWWINGFPKNIFEEGFGLETPIVQGQLRVIRYYSYFQKAFDVVKGLLTSSEECFEGEESSTFPQRCCFTANGSPFYTSDTKDLIATSTSLADLWHAVGGDFYVTTRYRSLRPPPGAGAGAGAEGFIEGTRITLLASHPDGFRFTIRTPGTPARWALFEEEFLVLEQSLSCVLSDIRQNGTNDDNTLSLFKEALKWFYVWVIFAPLSRGSAVCGYACMHSILLAGGFSLTRGLPTGLQLDWEAILAPSLEIFTENALNIWLLASAVSVSDTGTGTDIETDSCGVGMSGNGILSVFLKNSNSNDSSNSKKLASSFDVDSSRTKVYSPTPTPASASPYCDSATSLLQFFENSSLRVMLFALSDEPGV